MITLILTALCFIILMAPISTGWFSGSGAQLIAFLYCVVIVAPFFYVFYLKDKYEKEQQHNLEPYFICPKCGEHVLYKDRFCSKCGEELTDENRKILAQFYVARDYSRKIEHTNGAY